jgi:hypothetical protein
MNGSPTRSGSYFPPSPLNAVIPFGTSAAIGYGGQWFPFNTITYLGQTYPNSTGQFSYSTPPVTFYWSPTPYELRAPFTFNATAYAQHAVQGPPQQTFQLTGQGTANAFVLPCHPEGVCFYGVRYDFHGAAPPPTPPSGTPPSQPPVGPSAPGPSQAPASNPPATAPVSSGSAQRERLTTLAQVPRRPGIGHVILNPPAPLAMSQLHPGVEVLGQLPNGNVVLDLCRNGGHFCGLSTAELPATGNAGLFNVASAGTMSPTVVNPEPGTLALLGTGAAWLLRWRGRRTLNAKR